MIRSLNLTEDDITRLKTVARNCGVDIEERDGVYQYVFGDTIHHPNDRWLMQIIGGLMLRVQYLESWLHISHRDAVDAIEATKIKPKFEDRRDCARPCKITAGSFLCHACNDYEPMTEERCQHLQRCLLEIFRDKD